ncbi:maltose porter [Mycena filopes]|nr:maltose porter [Mycena filopes]
MLNPTGGNLGGKCGYVWGATGFICWITAYFFLPEMKGRSYRELDLMFKRRVPARKFEKTTIGVQEDE